MLDIFLLIKLNLYEPIKIGLSTMSFFDKPIINNMMSLAELISGLATVAVLYFVLLFPLKLMYKVIKKLVRL